VTFYADELARIHDEGFGGFARAAAGEALTRLQGSGLVVELGCGSGISTEILSDAGYDVLGIDISPAMLAIARSRAPRAQFRAGSVWDVELPRCAAVTAFGEVLNYAADERAGAARLPDLFARIFQALAPPGLFLFDVATPGRGGAHSPGAQTIEGPGWQLEAEVTEDTATRTLERRIAIDVHGERHTERHLLHLYEPRHVEECLDAAGFQYEALERYGDFGFWPGYAGFAAAKSSAR